MAYVQFDIDRNRTLQTANQGYYAEPTLHPDRTLSIHDIVYLVEGQWEIWEERRAFVMNPGDVLILSAGRHHFGRSGCRPGTRTLWVHAYPEAGDAYVGAGTMPANTTGVVFLPSLIATGQDPTVRSLMESIVRGYWSTSATKQAKARVLLTELLLELSGTSRKAGETSISTIDHVIEFIERNPGRFFTIDRLAEIGQVNRRTFTSRFRQRTGRSPHAFQTALKIRMAASILSNVPETPIKEVARTFGFYDEFHFSKAFKQATGMPPSRYRPTGSKPNRDMSNR